MIRITVRDGATGQVLAVSSRRDAARHGAGRMRAGKESDDLRDRAAAEPKQAQKKEEQQL